MLNQTKPAVKKTGAVSDETNFGILYYLAAHGRSPVKV